MQLTSLSLALTRAGFLSFSPASLFAASEPGVWYEPSLTNGTCFQDAAGTTPVTAVEQPVGLILDKSKGLTLGPELVTNGTFDADSDWTKGAGVTISSGRANLASATANAIALEQTGYALSVGRFYRITFNVSNYVSGAINLRFGNNTLNTIAGISANGSYTYLIQPANVGTQSLSFYAQTTTATLSIDNISVRELPGNHAYQTTSTSRPVLSARYNLLTKTEQFDDAVWVKTNATVTANAAVAPDGTLTADRLVTGGAGNSLKSVNQSFSAAAATYTLGIYVKDNGGVARSVELFFATTGLTATVGTIYNFDTNTLTNLPSAGPFTLVSSSRVLVGNGWHRIEITITVSSAQSILIYAAAPYLAAQIGDYYIWGASLVPANQASLPYQRVNTATDYDADPSKFKPYLRFDGVDDWLVTPTITPGTDKVQVFAGVRKLSDAARGMVAELSATTANSGSFGLEGPGFGAGATYGWTSKGTLNGTVTPTGFSAPITNVLTGLGDIAGDTATLRVNGTQVAQSTADQGTGNYLAYPIYIGRRGGTTLPFNGHLYSLIVRFGSNLPAATIASTETWLNQRTGAY